LFVAEEHVVLLEVDEHQHQNYNASCEISRISEIMDSIDASNLHVIRYNQHAKGTTTKSKKAILKEVLQTALSTNLGKFNDTGCVVQYVGYSEDRIQHLDQLTCELQNKPGKF